jgi:hypothetical protein
VRLVLDRMVSPSGGWPIFETTTVGNGTVRTNDEFEIIRHVR